MLVKERETPYSIEIKIFKKAKRNDKGRIRTDDPEGIRFLVLRINRSPTLPVYIIWFLF